MGLEGGYELHTSLNSRKVAYPGFIFLTIESGSELTSGMNQLNILAIAPISWNEVICIQAVRILNHVREGY